MKQENRKDETTEIDLLELFFELLAHWKMLLASTVLVGLIAYVISAFIITPKYQSTAKLYIDTKSTSITSLADLQMGTSLANDYIEVVAGRPVLDQVIKNLKLEDTYKELKERVSLNNPTNSRILEITVTDADPKEAKAIADEIANVSSQFIGEKMNQAVPNTIQSGYADGTPVSPSVGKNTVIGALLGFLLAAAIIILSYMLNDSIMTAEDVERKLGIHVLGTLPLDVAEDDGVKKKKKDLPERRPAKKA